MNQPHEDREIILNGLKETDQLPSLSPLVVEGEKAFARDLPCLLKERPGQWVAYHGNKLLGFARTSRELYEKAQSAGLTRGEFIVHRIEAEVPDEHIPPFDVEVALSLRHLQRLRSQPE